MKHLLYFGRFIWEVAKIAIIALLIVVPIRYFVFQPFIVRGISMEPALGHGNYLIVDQLSFRLREPQRGEIIVFRRPRGRFQYHIKRIIGLPGETIKIVDGEILIYKYNHILVLNESTFLPKFTLTPGNIQINLTKNEFFVMGDNRQASVDSRQWGGLNRELIIGRAFLRLWPLDVLDKFEAPIFKKTYLPHL